MTGRSLLPLLAALALGLGAAPAAAQTLTVGQAQPPTALDPHFHARVQNNANSLHVFDTLIGYDARLAMQPRLATAWRPVGETAWDFTLRDGVRFQDGTPLTADDVVFSFERAPTVPNSPGSFGTATRAIRAVEAVGPLTVRFHTTVPSPQLPGDVAQIFIVSRRHGAGATTEDYNSGRAMVGTGPFRFVEWVPGERLTYARSPDWWGGRAPWERVVFRQVSNGPARVAALLAGDIDLIADVPTSDVPRLAEDRRVALFTTSSVRMIYLNFDPSAEALQGGTLTGHDGQRLARNPLGDPRVRRALAHATNRESLAERLYEGQAIAAHQIAPEGSDGFDPAMPPLAFDPDRARALLAEAGFPQGFRMTLYTSNDSIPNSARAVQAIAQMWQRIGVVATIETMPHTVFSRRRGLLELPAFLADWSGRGELIYTLAALLHTRDGGFGAANRVRYSNPELDALIRAAAGDFDTARRGRTLLAAARLARDDAGLVPVVFTVNTWAGRAGVVTYEPRMDNHTLATSARPAR
jgi:peptide/nickel transport system substrate-binding protein